MTKVTSSGREVKLTSGPVSVVTSLCCGFPPSNPFLPAEHSGRGGYLTQPRERILMRLSCLHGITWELPKMLMPGTHPRECDFGAQGCGLSFGIFKGSRWLWYRHTFGNRWAKQWWQFHFLFNDGFRLVHVTGLGYWAEKVRQWGIRGKASAYCSRPRMTGMCGLLQPHGSMWGAGWGRQERWEEPEPLKILWSHCLNQPRDGPASEFSLCDLLNIFIIWDPFMGLLGT